MYRQWQAATPADIYAEVDRASRALAADPHGLIMLLYEELLLALAVACRAARRGNRSLYEDRRQRAVVLLSALDSGLDRKANAALVEALSTTYRGLAAALTRATLTEAEQVIEQVHASVEELADAWGQIGSAR